MTRNEPQGRDSTQRVPTGSLLLRSLGNAQAPFVPFRSTPSTGGVIVITPHVFPLSVLGFYEGSARSLGIGAVLLVIIFSAMVETSPKKLVTCSIKP